MLLVNTVSLQFSITTVHNKRNLWDSTMILGRKYMTEL